MLLRYGIENHFSICDRQELSFAASPLKDDPSHLIWVENDSMARQAFLPVIALYGANAAGKSNVIASLQSFCKAISRSYAWMTSDDKRMPFSPALLHEQFLRLPVCRNADVLIENVRYHYGFENDADGVVREWLYSYPNRARKVLFLRDFTAEDKKDRLYFGPSLKKLDSTLRDLAENRNCLFLSAGGTLGQEQLAPILTFFRDKFEFLYRIEPIQDRKLGELLSDDKIKNFIVGFLGQVDTGIVDIEVIKKDFDSKNKELMQSVLKNVKIALSELAPMPENFGENSPEFSYLIEFVHQGEDGSTFRLDPAMESSGTLHLLSILSPLLSAIIDGKTLVIDEITTSLHTKLSQELVRLFTSMAVNTNGAQFIFSTHDTNLLASDLLRRDEIWFAEKDKDGKTSIYPLTDFHTRQQDNVEKGYLQGRFGAIPFFGDVTRLFEASLVGDSE